MREIKYRALAKVTYNYETHNSQYKIKEGDWVFGYYYRDVLDNEDSCSYFHVDYIRIKYGDHYGDIEVDGDTVGQFTGMLDTNWVEIYEGDIVSNGENRYIVEWNNEDFCFETTLVGRKYGLEMYMYENYFQSEYVKNGKTLCGIKVIGNSYQHTYLLRIN